MAKQYGQRLMVKGYITPEVEALFNKFREENSSLTESATVTFLLHNALKAYFNRSNNV